MAPYLASWWIRIGLALVVVGWGPLIAIGVLAAVAPPLTMAWWRSNRAC